MELARPTRFKEAIDKLGERTPIASTLRSQEWSEVPVGLRERAFFSAQVENVRFLQTAQDSLGDFLANKREIIPGPDGTPTTALKTGSRADFVHSMRKLAIEQGMGDLLPESKRGGLEDITSNRRLSLIFDVQTTAAWEFGNWKQGQDPAILDEFPAQRFIREREVAKPREIHRENEGVVRRKDDLAFWTGMNSESIGGFGVPWGPWGFGSGMGVEDVTRDEAEALGLVAADETVVPFEKPFNEGLRASVSGLAPDLVSKLQSAFGDRIEFVGGEARWKPAPASPRRPATRPPAPAAPTTPPAPATPPTVAPIAVPPTPPAPTTRRAPAAPRPRPGRAPAARPSKWFGVPPGVKPVSDAVDLANARRAAPIARRALDAINSVHGDGTIEPLPVIHGAGGSLGVTALGRSKTGNTIGISHVGIRSDGPWPELTAVHEFGHVLDVGPLGGYANFATHKSAGPLAGVMDSIRKSAAHAGLDERAKNAGSARERKRVDGYLKSPHELFARAYAQFVTEESGDPILAAQLEKRRTDPNTASEQWDTADFAPIREAFRGALKTAGWMQ